MRERERSQICRCMQENLMECRLPLLSQEEFEQYPMRLSVSLLFDEEDYIYTYPEYREHWEETEAFAAAHPNYRISTDDTKGFRNIQITVHEREWAMISKNRAPAIHFVIRHPILRGAIEQLSFPV